MQDGQFPLLPNTEFENKLNNSNFGKGRLVSQSNVANTQPTLSLDDLTNLITQQSREINASASKPSQFESREIQANSIDNSGRYPLQFPGEDNEDLYAQAQSGWEQAWRGTVKGLGLAATTFLQGTLGLVYGVGSAISDQRLASLYDNDLSNWFDKFNKSTDNSLANYYTARERSAEWYEPANIFTANFLFDKIVKNAGFSIGALAAGGAISTGIRATLGSIPLFNSVAQVSNVANKMEQSLSLVPQTQRLNAFQNIIKSTSGAANRLSSILPGIQSERAAISILGAITEGGIEAQQGLNAWRTARINEYTDTYGYLPSGEDLKKINDAADAIGNSTLGMNIALLTSTNFIQLPRILGNKYTTRKAIANTEAAALGETYGVTKDIATNTFKAKLPSKLINNRLTQLLGLFFSPSEAFEEGAQFVIQKGTEDYFDKAYRGDGFSFLESLGIGVKETLNSKEGMESILIGGISGGLQQIRSKSISNVIAGKNVQKENNTNTLIERLNNSELNPRKWTTDIMESTSRGINLMKEEEQHIKNGDVLEAKDNEADQIINYLGVRIKHGRYDLVKDDINRLLMDGSNPQGLEKLKSQGYADQEDTVESFTQRLSKFSEQAATINSLYKSLNTRYSSLYNVDGERAYPEEVIDKMVYAGAKVANYDNRIPELSENLNQYSIPIQTGLDKIVENGNISEVDTRDVLNMINNLNITPDGYTITSDQKDDLKRDYRDILEMALRRKEYLKEYESIKISPSNYYKPVISDVSGGSFNVSQKKGRKTVQSEIEVGKQYSLSSPIIRDGNTIVLAPKITAQSQTLKGEIETTLPNGETTFIPLSEFKSYTLSDLNNDSEEIEDEFIKSVDKIVKKPQFQSLLSAYENADKTPEALQRFVSNADNKLFTDAIIRDLKPKISSITERIKKEQEELEVLRKNEELRKKLEKEQKDINGKTGIESSDETTQDGLDKEDEGNKNKKAPLANFLSKEADFYDKTNPKPHQKRRLNFLTNLSRIWGSNAASKVRVLTITKNNEAHYGLKGLNDFVKKDTLDNIPTDKRGLYFDKNNNFLPEHEPIIKLYVLQDKGKFVLVGEDGKKLSELSGNVTQEAISKGIFGVFHSSIGGYKFSNKEGESRIDTKEKEDLERAENQLKEWRKQILSYTDKAGIYSIDEISRGIVIRDSTNKSVINTLVKEEDLDNDNLIVIPTIYKAITVGGVSLNFPVGRPLIKIGSTVDFLNNRKFSKKESENIFNLLKSSIKSTERSRIFNYLSGILYMKSGENNSQLFISNNSFVFKGFTIPFTEAALDSNKDKIVQYFENIYQKTNNKFLKPEKFEEVYVENGEVKFKSHSTYQRYLLSPQNGNTPFLRTLIAEKVGDEPNIISRYTTLKSNEFNFQQTPKKVEEKGEVTFSESPKTGGIKLPDNIFGNSKEPDSPNPQIKLPSITFSDPTETKQEIKLPKNFGFTDPGEKAETNASKTKSQVKPDNSTINKKEGNKYDDDQDLGEFSVSDPVKRYDPINIQKELAYIKEKSSFNVEILNEIIKTPEGIFAWGKYKRGLISLYQAAQQGTGYHELFEGVWKEFTSSKEKSDILKEFRNRKGSFTFFDGSSYSQVSYSSANEFQIKEILADEFAAFVLSQEKPQGNFLAKWFINLWNFIKSIFNGNIGHIDNLFKNIDAGKYKSVAYNPNSLGEEFSFADRNYLSQSEIVRGTALQLMQEILNPNVLGKPIVEFEESTMNVDEAFDLVYDRFEKLYTEQIPSMQGISENELKGYYQIWENIKEDWNEIKEYTTEYLKTFGIISKINDENVSEDRTKNENYSNRDYVDDRKYFENDAKNTASRSIKLLFLTLPETIINNNNKLRSRRTSSTFMQEQMQYAKNFNSLLSQVSELNGYHEKIEKLRELGEQDGNFRRVFERLNTDYGGNIIDQWKLKVRFFTTFSKQSPTVYIQYNQKDGSSRTGSTNLDNSVKNIVQTWIDQLKNLAISGSNITDVAENGDLILKTKSLSYEITTVKDKINFLNQLTIPFTEDMYNKLSSKEEFNTALSGLATDLKKKTILDLDDARAWKAVGNMDKIAKAFIQAGNDFESTFFSIDGERTSKFPSTNKVSRDFNDINNSDSIENLYEAMPQLEQVKDSIYLNEILFRNGKRTSFTFDIGYIQGTINKNGKPVEGEKLTRTDRLVQEINQNLEGRYYILVPADSKTQWLTNMKNYIPFKDITNNSNDWTNSWSNLMYNYYLTEQVSYFRRKEEGLPAYSGIFTKISNNYTLDEAAFKTTIEALLQDRAFNTGRLLRDQKVLKAKSENKLEWTNLDQNFLNSEFSGTKNKHKNLSSQEVVDILTFREANYMINNIELQRLLFGDPLEYKDATKRYKLFLSPREASIHGVPELNIVLDEEYNKSLPKEPLLGWTKFSDEFSTVTIQNVKVEYSPLKEGGAGDAADAQAYSTLPAMRARRLKTGNWTEKDEQQFQYNMARDRQLMLLDGILNNKNYPKELQEKDIKTSSKGNPNISFYYVEKPIVSGHTSTNGEYHPIVDKFSIASLPYSAIRNTNFRDHYVKMLKQEIGYIVMASGRKVGARGSDIFYDDGGNINKEPFKNIINIHFSTFGIQTDTSSKKESQTRGTQITKLAIVNLYDNGVAISEDADKLAKENIALLKEQTEIGYRKLLQEIGAEDVNGEYRIVNKEKILKLVTNELLRREVADSIKKQLKLKENGELFTPFEALPNYQQIKNILYSYVDKYITSPKVSGGPKVQMSGVLMENYGIKRVKIKGKDVYISSGLKFYTKEEPWCEVLMPAYFSKKLRAAGLQWDTEEELMDIINKSPDRDKILSGVGFRIPTQELNSIENFRIKGFLPEEMGDTIVVPEEITTKTGSDFDIDKLNTYLQNIYVDAKKQIRVVPYFGVGEIAIKKLGEWYKGDVLEGYLSTVLEEDIESFSTEEWENIENELERREAKIIDRLYNQSIENRYFENIQEILSLPINFERLITPNTVDDLRGIRDDLVDLSYTFTSTGVNTIINSEYMLDSRHNGQSVKRLVGISALAQTGTAISQLSNITLDLNNIEAASFSEKEILNKRKGTFLLPHNSFEGKPTISSRKDVEGRFITDKISQYINGTVDVFKDAFLAQINFNQRTAGVYLMLERLGVPNSRKNPIVSLFMNQPIIRELLNKADVDGIYNLLNNKLYTKIYNHDSFVGQLQKELPKGMEELKSLLRGSIKNFYESENGMTREERGYQRLILDEFRKYIVYSNHLFKLQQGTNYDTATLNDSYLYKIKELQTQDAVLKNLWSSADKFLNSSFIQKQREAINNINTIFSDVFKIENPITQKYLYPYIESIGRDYLSANDKLRVFRKLEEALLNYLIQIGTKINNSHEHLMINSQTALVKELRAIKKLGGDIANNLILKQLSPFIRGKNDKTTKNITLSVKARDVFTKNLYTGAFNELYNNPNTQEFARKLVKLSFLQNGVSNSPISFKDAIPADLYSETINYVIDSLTNEELLQKFVETDAFYRNNWDDADIIDTVYLDENPLGLSTKYREYTEYLKQKGEIESAPSIAWINPKNGNDKVINHIETFEEEEGENKEIKRLFRRVEDSYGNPIVERKFIETENGGYERFSYLYIQINAWGDSWRANEYYDNKRRSVYNNGYIKVHNELNINQLASFMNGDLVFEKSTIEEKEEYQKPTFTQFRNYIFEQVLNVTDSSFDWRITLDSTLTQSQREKAITDFKTGKSTKGVEKMLNSIREMYENDVVTMNRGRGNQAQTTDFPMKEVLKDVFLSGEEPTILENKEKPVKKSRTKRVQPPELPFLDFNEDNSQCK